MAAEATGEGFGEVAGGDSTAQVWASSGVSLRKRILTHLASEQHPELADIRVIHKREDVDPAMPRFVTAFLASRLGCS